jgi:hypothetical protein
MSGYARKSNPRQVYRLKQRERIEASPLLAKQFPRLHRLRVNLEYFDPTGETRQGGLKCELSLEHAHSVLWFACPAVDCLCGDFDLTTALAQAVAKRRTVAEGELRCLGQRKRGERERVPCQTLLRYKLQLNYD